MSTEEIRILCAALLWARNHLEAVHDQTTRDRVVARLDRILKHREPTAADMQRFRELYDDQVRVEVSAKYPGTWTTPPNSAEIKIDESGAMTMSTRSGGVKPVTWADGLPVYAGQIKEGSWLALNIETGVLGPMDPLEIEDDRGNT